MTTPRLFARYPDAAALAKADPADVEVIIKSLGFFRMKTRNIIAASQAIVERHGGHVPADRDALEALPGVGRKTASVVMSVAFAAAELAVDTHVFRVAHRLGLTTATTPRGVEDDVVKLVPLASRRHAHHWLILHGRTICKAPVPQCGRCPVAAICPSEPIVARALSTRAVARKPAPAKPRKPARDA